MKFLHVIALSAGLAGAALFAGPTQAATTTNQTVSLTALGADGQSFYTEQDVAINGFREEVDRAALDGAYGIRYLAVSRHEDNGHRHRTSCQRGLQIEPV